MTTSRPTTDLEAGLTTSEAARLLTLHGPNEIRAAPPVPTWRKVLAQFQDPLVYLLVGAVVISIAAWLFEGAQGVPVDAVVITLIIIGNAVLGYLQQARAEAAVAALQRMTQLTSTAIRDGKVTSLPTTELVPGDVLALAEGDKVGADAVLRQTAALRIAESSLTGESEPVAKSTDPIAPGQPLGDQTNMVFKGTAVTQGTGLGIVTATGMLTEIGAIARLLESTAEHPTPLQVEIARVGRMLGFGVLIIAAVTMSTIWVTNDVRTAADAVTVLLLGVSLAVAAVPEGLPAILLVVLAIGVQRMADQDAIVKRLSSVETLGSTSVICSDKTGTLTRNEMTMQRVMTPAGTAHLTGVGYEPTGEVLGADREAAEPGLREEAARVISGGSLASNAVLRQVGDDWEILGDPTEAAFLVAERKLGGTATRQDRFTRIGQVPFTSQRKIMSTIEIDHARDDERVLVTKGAPDVLLKKCTQVRAGPETVPLTSEVRQQILLDVEAMSADALRTLAVAYRPLTLAELGEEGPNEGPRSSVETELAQTLEHDLIFAGTVGLIDPARSEAGLAIAEASRAGIRTIMITGDHPATALAIAQDLAIAAEGEQSLTGSQIAELDDKGLQAAVHTTSVFARVAPAQKLRIVDALQHEGHIVAMTGDGVNDAPALKSADIGVAMGVTGTEVTKEAAAMILADDNFATIVLAVRQGRVIFDNIKKFLRYLLSSNLGEVLTIFGGVVLAGPLGLTAASDAAVVVPLLATQILWINLVTDSGPALAMGVDPETEDVMSRAPRSRTDRIIDRRMWTGVMMVGAVIAGSTLLTIDIFLPGGLVEGDDTLAVARTAGFTTLVLAQLFNAFNSRSETQSAFRGMFVNRWLMASVAFGLLAQVVVVEVPVLQAAFGTQSLDAVHWLVCVALASTVLWFDEARKLGQSATAAIRAHP